MARRGGSHGSPAREVRVRRARQDLERLKDDYTVDELKALLDSAGVAYLVRARETELIELAAEEGLI